VIKSKVLRVLAAVLLGTGLLVAQPQAAFAAGCSRYACDGQDPIKMGCDNVRTGSSVFVYSNSQSNFAIGTIELRYSATCRTAWARLSFWKEWYGGVSSPYGQINRIADNKHFRCTNVVWSNDLAKYSCYTPMVNDADLISFANTEVVYYGTNVYAETGRY
jgi:hypothetical protein